MELRARSGLLGLWGNEVSCPGPPPGRAAVRAAGRPLPRPSSSVGSAAAHPQVTGCGSPRRAQQPRHSCTGQSVLGLDPASHFSSTAGGPGLGL